MVEIEINDKKLLVNKDLTIIQACKEAGIEVPRFCYHEKLSIAGNCRMCLVEVVGSPKPQASCAMPIAEGMKIKTDTKLVQEAREGVMELLLANHPLDCPICDQGGECDLQDQAMVFGNDRGRFYEMKRAVEDKDIGPLIKTIMTRCIHCTRCVRYSNEIAGITDLGTTGRGNSMEIGTYVKNMCISEVSGNVIDLCPVGALTSKPYAFVARPWELEKTESIDIQDGMGSNIQVCTRGKDIMRVLPLPNEDINEEWITDKTRFAYDGLRKQRLTTPMLWDGEKYINITWDTALTRISEEVHGKGRRFEGLLGSSVEMESAVVMKDLANRLGGVVRLEEGLESVDNRNDYKFNTNFTDISAIDMCLIIGTNIKTEMPLLAVKLRKEQRERGIKVLVVGPTAEYYLDAKKIGNGGKTIIDILEGRHKVCAALTKARKVMVIVGNNGLGDSRRTIVEGFLGLKKYGNIEVNVLTTGANNVGLYDIGLGLDNKKESEKNSLLYIVGCDNIEIQREQYGFVVYQGHIGDNIAGYADLILPGVNHTEKEGIYVNVEGRAQTSNFIFYPTGEARVDWHILKCVEEYLVEKGGSYNDLLGVRERIYDIMPYRLNSVKEEKLNYNEGGREGIINRVVYNNYLHNYYMTDSISRASKVMAICTAKIEEYKSNYKWKL